MRLASMIPRLTVPRIIQGSALPTFGQICRLSEEKEELNEPSLPFTSVSSEIALPSLFSTSTSSSSSSSSGVNNNVLPRAIFLGEQHHQPKVLSGQLQLIYEIFKICKEPRKVHIVLEHWSLDDQPYLNQLNNQIIDEYNPGLIQDDKTSEGFSASHYLTIIKLVRELGGTVWGGFPPRSWAKLISKSESCVFDQVQRLDQERYETHGDSTAKDNIIPPLPVEDYKYVEEVSWSHRIYLKSMFRPDKRPQVVSGVQNSPPKEKHGFLAAQALKDTFLAHCMSSLLVRDSENIVVAVTGLGHCEWGYGAPKRLRKMTNVDPFIILTKPEDAGYWSSNSSRRSTSDDQLISNWQDYQADAIVLYEWVD